MSACEACLARGWLLSRLGGHLEVHRARIQELLELSQDELIDAVGGRSGASLHQALAELTGEELRAQVSEAGLEVVCRCRPDYPGRLRDLRTAPAALYVAGGLDRLRAMLDGDVVAIVGARRASSYGLEVARSLAGDLAGAGVPVLSGMAIGVDAAAHSGALDRGPARGGATGAVLPGSASNPYPPSRRALHRRIVAVGVVVSELPPGSGVWRWAFPARNRVIAALAGMTVVVEAGERSGSLVTAGIARRLGRPLGAVPGRITSPQARGSNQLLAEGAQVVRGAQDVLDVLYGSGVRPLARRPRPALEPSLERLLAVLAGGADSASALQAAGLSARSGLAALAELELAGLVRRGPGGSYTVTPS